MSSALILNSTNAILNPSTNTYSTFKYTFPSNSSFQDKQLLLTSIVYPFSNFNFRANPYQNTQFGVTWINGTGATVTLQDGYYDATSINQSLQEFMISQGWYTQSGTGATLMDQFYLTIQPNSTFYSEQLNSFPVPTAAQAAAAGIYQPTPITWAYPAVATNPQFVILPPLPNPYGTSFSASLGFNPQTWPATGTPGSNQSLLSNFTPQINPVTTVVVLCSLVNNTFARQNQVLFAFSTGDTEFGAYKEVYPPQELWLQCSRGNFSDFTLTFVDQTTNNPIPLQDNTITAMLSVRDTPIADRGVKLAQGR